MNKQLIIKLLASRLSKFLVVGVINTTVSYLLFITFIQFTNYSAAYSLSYSIGIITSYILNGVWTFNKSISIKGLITYPVVYASQFLSGWIILKVAVETFKISESEAYILALLVSIPVGFLASKVYFRKWN